MMIRMKRWMFAAAALSVGAAWAVQTSTELAREEFDAYVRRISGKAFPAAVEIVSALPRTKMEKTDYRALEEMELRKNASR